ncbi:MAG: sulfurtransferase [Actinomyces sp.]|nr:MAG: sulfurtransferase [Actinomyces sp.]
MSTDTPTTDTRTVGPLVGADWLAAHLDDPGVRVVEVDVSGAAHDEGHIPGAVLWNIYTDIKDPDYAFVGSAAFAELVQRSGIDADSTVVFYGYAPAFGYWLLRLFGHRDVHILDTSRDTWQAAGHPWSAEPSTPAPTTHRLVPADPTLRASLADVMTAIDRPDETIIDVRSPLEYAGERFWPSGGMHPDGVAGHVPGAVNSPADGYLDDDGSFRDPAALAGLFPDLGPDDPAITYCTIGARASTAWFVLTELLGHNGVRVYDGSWAEWGLDSSVPVEV